MRDFLNALQEGREQADPDPVRRVRDQMRRQLPKRFYTAVSLEPEADGFSVRLDGKPVRTPGKALLSLPCEAAARLVADEFSAQGEEIDPFAMPALRLANTAIDAVGTGTQNVIDSIVGFAASDLLCYRADAPRELAEIQTQLWNPPVEWALATLGARFVLAEGIIHIVQPKEALEAVELYLKRREEPFRLTALHVMTTLTNSALLALAVEAGEMTAREAWRAAHVDDAWNASQWGEDEEATERREARWRDMAAAEAFIEALGQAR